MTAPVAWNPEAMAARTMPPREEREAPERLARAFAALLWREVLKQALPEWAPAAGFAAAVHRDMLLDVLAERVAEAAGGSWLPPAGRVTWPPAGGRR